MVAIGAALSSAPRLAAAHGPPAAVTGIAARDDAGLRVVSLTEGFAVRQPSGWRWICPVAFGVELSPPSASIDGERAYVVGQYDLYAIEADGGISAQSRPDLSRQSVLSCGVVGGRIFALRLLPNGMTDVVAFDSAMAIWQDSVPYDSMTPDVDSLWVARVDGTVGRAFRLGTDGAVLEAPTFAVDAGDKIIRVQRIGGTLYANVVTAASGGKLLQIEDGDSGPRVVIASNAPVGGPVSAGGASAWATADGLLQAIDGDAGAARATSSPASCVGTYGTDSYLCAQTQVLSLGPSGPGDELFTLSSLQGPAAGDAPEDAGQTCSAQWDVFRYDLERAGIVVDAGPDPGASPPSSAPRAGTGGCAIDHAALAGPPPARAWALVAAMAAGLALRRRMRRRLHRARFAVATALCATGAAYARDAQANGRFPAASQIVFSAAQPDRVVARTTFAVLQSGDDGETWRFLCEDALGLPPTGYLDPELAVTSGGALLSATTSPVPGLSISRDLGCTWACTGGGLAQQSVVDTVVEPGASGVVLAVTSTYVSTDAGVQAASQVFRSTDDAASWSPLGPPIDGQITVQTIDVAKSDLARIYLSGTRGYGSTRTASLLVTTDGGATPWTEYPIVGFDPLEEDSAFIAAVDPTNADRVYVRTSAVFAGGKSRVFVTDDGGASFRVAMTFTTTSAGTSGVSGEVLGFALSPDGAKVYAGTAESGLFVASSADLTFNHISSAPVRCLATRASPAGGTELWACSDATSGFVIGESNDDGAHFAAKLATVTALDGPIACTSSSGGASSLACNATVAGSQCQVPYEQFCALYGSDGRCAGPAGVDGSTSGRAGSCSNARPRPHGLDAIAAAAAVLVGGAWRARRRARPPRY